MLLLISQGVLGLKIRRERKRGKQNTAFIHWHRKTGQVLVVMGIAGFFAGLTLVTVEHGNILEFPSHLLTGSVLIAALIIQSYISGKIERSDNRIRKMHLAIGITIICLYFIQILLGINVLKQHDKDHDHLPLKKSDLASCLQIKACKN